MTSLRGARLDILVTDYHLLGATGVWLLESATAAGLLEGTAAIMLTSERRPPGGEGYTVLRKPVDIVTLLDAIGAAVGQALPAPYASPAPPRPVGARARALRHQHLAGLAPGDPQPRSRAQTVRPGAILADDDRRRERGDDAWYQSLEDDRIIVTPTLVKKSPGPKTWIVGTLASNDAVAQMLPPSSAIRRGRRGRNAGSDGAALTQRGESAPQVCLSVARSRSAMWPVKARTRGASQSSGSVSTHRSRRA
nr:hypothetical protein [Deltaproteobacteria bacterium]